MDHWSTASADLIHQRDVIKFEQPPLRWNILPLKGLGKTIAYLLRYMEGQAAERSGLLGKTQLIYLIRGDSRFLTQDCWENLDCRHPGPAFWFGNFTIYDHFMRDRHPWIARQAAKNRRPPVPVEAYTASGLAMILVSSSAGR